MNQFLNRLEKKFGRYAIQDLTKYIIVLYCAGAALELLLGKAFYYNYLALDMRAVFHGQIWRLFTYLIEPYGYYQGMGMIISILFFAIQVSLFLMFGRTLEQVWGTFRFNMYFLSGYLLNIVAALILYLSPLHAEIYDSGFQYIYWSMFFAYAAVNPDMKLLWNFIIPIRIKWLALMEALVLLYMVGNNLYLGIIYYFVEHQPEAGGALISAGIAILVALGNFLVFFFSTRNYHRISPGEIHRRRAFKKKVERARTKPGGTRHRCAVCGRTELDDPSLDFRYCSKCNGNYEYCSEHLFTHQHVK